MKKCNECGGKLARQRRPITYEFEYWCPPCLGRTLARAHREFVVELKSETSISRSRAFKEGGRTLEQFLTNEWWEEIQKSGFDPLDD